MRIQYIMKITIQDLCCLVVVVYIKENKKIRYVYDESLRIKKSNRHDTLQTDLNLDEDENSISIIGYYKSNFENAIQKYGHPASSFDFSIYYDKEYDINNIISRLCLDNQVTPIIALVTGSKYIDNDNYESVAYVIDF